jgi:hypothetical protein
MQPPPCRADVFLVPESSAYFRKMSSRSAPGRVALFAAAVGLVGTLFPAIAQRPPDYRDPRGRFTLQVPPGWNTTQMNSDAVQFAGAPAYVTMMVLPSNDPVLMMNSIAKQTGTQWRNFMETGRGATNLGGRTGQFVTYSGTNPMGADSNLQLIGVTDGPSTYLLMISAPKADFQRLKNTFAQIEQSFTLTAAAKPPEISKSGPASVASKQPPAAPIPPQDIPAAGGNGNVYRMKLVRIVDERGFERPMTALTLLIPADWQFQGSVQYGQATGCHANLVNLTLRAVSPDNRLAIELFPGNTWQWADDPNMVNMMRASNQQMARFGARGCDVMAPMTADNFLRQSVIPAVRRGARATGSEPMPDAAQQLQEEARQLQQAAPKQGMRVNIRTDVSRVRVSYALNGQPVEEWFTAMTSSTGMAGPSFNVRTGRAGQSLYYSNTADHVFGLRAPQGQLDAQEKFFQLVLGTMRVDPQWQARVTQVIANLQAQDTKGAADRSAIITKAGQDMSKSIHDAYQNATTSREHSMAAWSQYMRGVQTFRNPNTGETVELSNQYGHAWAGPDNQYVVTDSASFNPNASLQGNWNRLEPVSR